jgi:hypothetical protein
VVSGLSLLDFKLLKGHKQNLNAIFLDEDVHHIILLQLENL